MIKIKNVLMVLLLLGMVTPMVGQHNEKAIGIIKKCQALYANTSNFSMNTRYNLYQGEQGKDVKVFYEGKIAKKGEDFYMLIDSTEFVITKGENLKVSHKQRAMQYIKGEVNEKQNPLDIEQFLPYFKIISVKDQGKKWQCELTSQKLTQLPYQKITLIIDKQTNRLEKQILLFIRKSPFKGENGEEIYEYPKLELLISDYKEEKIPLQLFNISKYVKVEANNIKPTVKYLGYEMFTK